LWPEIIGYNKGKIVRPQELCGTAVYPASGLFSIQLIGARDIESGRRKLDWIASNGGMALMIHTPDYICFDGRPGLCDTL